VKCGLLPVTFGSQAIMAVPGWGGVATLGSVLALGSVGSVLPLGNMQILCGKCGRSWKGGRFGKCVGRSGDVYETLKGY
jgi:hypothetical protein